MLKDDSTLQEAVIQARNVRRYIDRLTEAAYGVTFAELIQVAAGRCNNVDTESGNELRKEE